MKLFGTSGLGAAKAKPFAAKSHINRADRFKTAARVFREAVRQKPAANGQERAKSAPEAQGPDFKPKAPPEPAEPDREPGAHPAFRLRPLNIGQRVGQGARFCIRWTPFAVALIFVALVIRQVTDNFQAFAVGQADREKRETATPIKPPVIYQQGLTPLSSDDDRIPISALSKEYNLNDPMLVSKLTGIGAISVAGSRCTASLVGRRDFVVTASHCLVDSSKPWMRGRVFRFYSPICKQWYSGTSRYIRTRRFQERQDLDYAFLKLDTSVCDAAEPFQALTLTDEAARELKERSHPLLALSVQEFTDARRHREFPEAWERAKLRDRQYTVFGVFARFSKKHSNISSSDGAMRYLIEGADAFGGASGGPLLVSLDRGKSYQIIATLYGHRTHDKLGIYPRIKGEYAQNLEGYFAKWNEAEEGGAS